MRNIQRGSLRIVCPEKYRGDFANILPTRSAPSGKKSSCVWLDERIGQKGIPEWAKGISFGEAFVTDDKECANILELVGKIKAEAETVGVMGVPETERIKALFFDMDATVIVEESLVMLAAKRGLARQIERITEEAMAGRLDFVSALRERVAMLKGTPLNEVESLQNELTLRPGICELVERCRERGILSFMVSGGFSILAEPIASHVGMAGWHANTFGIHSTQEIGGGGQSSTHILSGEVEGAIVDAQGKREYLLGTCQKYGIMPYQAIAVGDGANDLLMIEAAGYGVGLKPKEALRAEIHLQNQLGDHRILGYFLFGSL